ncbi:MAG: hypothetical protein FWD06_01915 [Oscillospiraceae bacterium]|nr:hypothetical protein [Oscillospiraceae bacterium]
MKAKHIIAIIAVLAIGATLLTGCEVNRPQAHYTPTPLAPGVDPFALSEAERQRLIDTYGLDPNTMMLPMPPDLEPVADQPAEPPLDIIDPNAGVDVLSSEVYPMLRNTINILGSGNFYLRGRTTVPATELTPQVTNNTPIAFASNGERAVLEQTVNWNEMLATDGFDFGASRIQAALFNGTFGDQMRMIIDSSGPIIAFPARNTFLSFADMIDFFGEEMPAMDMGDFDVMQIGDLAIPNELNATRVTVGGREYLTATIPNEEAGVNTFFFHNGTLARLQTVMPDGGQSVIEVDVFNHTPPAELFTTQGMRRMPMAELMQLMEGMGGGEGGGLFGGLLG